MKGLLNINKQPQKVIQYEIQPYDVNAIISYNGQVIKRQTIRKDVKKCKSIHNGTTTIVILDDGSKGVAKLNPKDTYNGEIGYGVAYFRAKIKQAEKQLELLYSGKFINEKIEY